MLGIVGKCKNCGTTESPSWWKCCPVHTTEKGSDVVCQDCSVRFHPSGYKDLFNEKKLFVCSLCLFVPKPNSPDNDDRLTVIGGEMVCVDHQGYVTPISGLVDYYLKNRRTMRDRNWPERCALTSCKTPTLQPHHHHIYSGHITTHPCQCLNIQQPGTRSKDIKSEKKE